MLYILCMSVGEHVVKQSADVDRIKIYYNEFKSAIAYEIREVDLMPRHRFTDIAKTGNWGKLGGNWGEARGNWGNWGPRSLGSFGN